MNLIANTRSFTSALNRLVGVTKPGVLPITQYVKIIHFGYDAFLCGTDLETGIQVAFRAENEGDSEICVNCKDLVELLKAVKDPMIVCSADEKGRLFIVKCKKGEYTLGTNNAADFPVAPKASSAAKFTLPVAVVKAGFQKTVFSVAEGTATNIAMTGVFVEVEPTMITFTSTNTTVLSNYEAKVPTKVAKNLSGIIPANSVTEIIRVLEGCEDDECTVAMTGTHFFLSTSTINLDCRFIDGRFPNYRGIIPARNVGTVLQIGSTELHESLMRLKVVTSEDHRVVMLKLGRDSMSVSAEAKELNKQGKDTIDFLTEFNGPSLNIQFNAVFLSALLHNIPGDVRFYFTDAKSVTRIEPSKQKAEGRHVCILAPYVPFQ